jgi:hypothetical protein
MNCDHIPLRRTAYFSLTNVFIALEIRLINREKYCDIRVRAAKFVPIYQRGIFANGSELSRKRAACLTRTRKTFHMHYFLVVFQEKMPEKAKITMLMLIFAIIALSMANREAARDAEIAFRGRIIELLEKIANVSHKELGLESMRPYIFQ